MEGGKEGRKDREMEERVRRMEKMMERGERKGKEYNYERSEEKKEEVIKDIRRIWVGIGVEMDIEEMKKIRTRREEKGEIVVIKLRSEEIRWKIMDRKRSLKKTEMWIEEEKTFKEKKIEWKLKKIAEEERRKGKKVRIGKKKIWIEDRWFYWLDKIQDVRDGKENRRSEKEGIMEMEGEEGRGQKRRK